MEILPEAFDELPIPLRDIEPLPVSYTHLLCFDRQEQLSTGKATQSPPTDSHGLDVVYHEPAKMSNVFRSEPVSYTHLQTVHFMNLVDEADLLALMEEDAADAYTAEKEAAAQDVYKRQYHTSVSQSCRQTMKQNNGS